MAQLEVQSLQAKLMEEGGARPSDEHAVFDITAFKAPAGHAAAFEAVNGHSYDFIMVLPCEDPRDAERSAKFIGRLKQAGLDVYAYKSVQDDEYICKIRCSVQRLAFQAASTNFKLPLDEQHVQRACAQGLPAYKIAPIDIADKKSITPYKPYAHHYARFVTEPSTAALFKCQPGLGHPFDSVSRIKLIIDIIQQPRNKNGVGFVLKRKLLNKRILGYYPLHDDDARDELGKKWLVLWQWPWQQPVDEIRNYFGEKIALFFLFCSHYTSWLLPLSIISVANGIDILAENRVDATLSPFYSIVVVFWAIFMLEFWKRKEATKAMLWGTTGFEEDESSRPEFKGKEMKSFIDGSQIKYYPPASRHKMVAMSQVAIFSLVVVVVAAIIAVVWVKIVMVQQQDDDTVNEFGLYIPALLNAVQIQVMNVIYSSLAVRLNNRENHRTDTEYENSLIAKLFAFQFVNSFASLYYTAFIKLNIEPECTNGGCMGELAVAVGTIFVTRLLSDNVSKYALPRVNAWWKMRQETKGVSNDRKMSRAEEEYVMDTYDEMMGSLQDFANLSIQFGYVSLFATAFPLAPILAFFSNCVNMVTDGHKLLHLHRRPIPRSAQDIGTWHYIFLITAVLAVITNAGLIMYTADSFDFLGGRDTVWVFFGCQYMVFVCMAAFSILVPDVPHPVEIQAKRTQFLVSKLIEHKEDDTIDEDLLETGGSRADEDEVAASAVQIHDHDKTD